MKNSQNLYSVFYFIAVPWYPFGTGSRTQTPVPTCFLPPMADTKIQECSSPLYIDKMAQYSTTMKQTSQFLKMAREIE